MKYILLISLLFILNKSYGQLPAFPDSYRCSDQEYGYALKIYEESLKGLQNEDVPFEYKSILYGWNAFMAFIKIKPKNKNVIYTIFHNRLAYEPISFCEKIKTKFNTKFKPEDNIYTGYRREVNYIFNICDCVLGSYDSQMQENLQKILDKDQKYRSQGNTQDIDGKLQLLLDSENQKEVSKIIEKMGYQGRLQVGTEYEDVMFLVMQHSNIEMIEKYLPILKQEVKNRNLKPRTIAYLTDRLMLLKKKPQVYGTQYVDKNGERELYEIENVNEVNYRRFKVGLTMLDQFEKPNIVNGLLIR